METNSDEAISSVSKNKLHENNVAASGDDNVNGSWDNILSKPQHPLNSGADHPSTGALSTLTILGTPREQGFFSD